MAPKFPKVAGFELIEEVGGGGFSTVYKAVNFETQRAAACKVILLTAATTDKDRKSVEKEMRIHSALKHENILEFINAVIVELKHADKYVPGFYMLLEFAGGGDLFDKIAPDVGVDDELAHLYFNQLVSGMKYIHNQGVCHRDLKPENLLLDVAGQLKITDFGLSSVFRLKESGKTRQLTERCGSLPYVAPELNFERPYDAEPVDVWGVGVILFTLLVGNTPWDEPTDRSTEFRSYVDGSIFEHAPWNRIGGDALSLIRGILEVDPRERFTLDDVMAHPWCLRPSQIANLSPYGLAERLTQNLRDQGDLNTAAPKLQAGSMDEDGDTIMGTANQSQFTQRLLLFSQTQGGTRYMPHLTRFYANLGPSLLLPIIQEALEQLEVKTKYAGLTRVYLDDPPADGEETVTERRYRETLKLRIGGFDHRKQRFKGWVEIERYLREEVEYSFILMRRDEGNPISWRQLYRALVQSEYVAAHVLWK
ncbi:CAMK/CAMKL/CHK1 protein kinase [Panaeolus papilionaceus]|nr:CAMK/CAMKL/CHK1 protein kinase [Panaeolus papilionaceus]